MLSQEHQLFHGTSEENLKSGVVSCFACSVRQEALQPVPFEGQFSKFLLLGRNPGREENETGRPFVGRAGQMVNEDYLPLMGLSRKEVIISNILKCHTYKNRVPLPSEVYFCRDMWLKQEILFFRPKVIFLLGNDCVRGIFGPKFPSVTDYHA